MQPVFLLLRLYVVDVLLFLWLREHAIDQREERAQWERLEQHGIRLELLDATLCGTHGGDDNDVWLRRGCCRAGGLKMSQHIPAGLIGQVDVEQDQVEWLRRGGYCFVGGGNAVGLGDTEATTGKVECDDAPQGIFVLDDENVCHWMYLPSLR